MPHVVEIKHLAQSLRVPYPPAYPLNIRPHATGTSRWKKLLAAATCRRMSPIRLRDQGYEPFTLSLSKGPRGFDRPGPMCWRRPNAGCIAVYLFVALGLRDLPGQVGDITGLRFAPKVCHPGQAAQTCSPLGHWRYLGPFDRV